jgi:hypothetical protein
MQKVFDFNAGTYVYIDDEELFGRTLPKSASTPTITCLVCGRPGTADPERPAICAACAADLSATRGHVVGMVIASERRIDTTLAACERAGAFPWLAEMASAVIPNPHADPAVADRMAAYHSARITGDPRAATVEAMARSGRADALLDLVRLWLDYQEAGERYAEIQVWAARCEEVLQ